MRTWAAVFAVLIIQASWAAAQGAPVGMVLDSNQARITRGGSEKAAQLADMLYAGDRIAGAATFLFCPSNETITLGSDGVAELGDSAITAARGQISSQPAGGCSLPQVALGEESLERVGGLRARGFPPIVVFLGGTVSSERPTFSWQAVEEAVSYFVALKNELGAVLWEEETGSTRLSYPESEPPLDPDQEYQWEVIAEKGGETVGQQWANFRVKPDPAAAPEAAESTAARLIKATELENAGYYAEAAAHYRKLREANPGDPRLTRRLTWLYWNAGLIAAATQERDALKEQN